MNEKSSNSFLERAQRILYRVEDSILVGLLMSMIILSVLQICLRNFFETGIVWSDVLVRILVLWLGLIGAMVASRKGNHINIDLIDRYLPERAKIVVSLIIELFTTLICLIVAYYSLQFVQMEFVDGGRAFAKVPTWVCEAIIPFAFTVIAIRYFILSFLNFKKVVKFGS